MEHPPGLKGPSYDMEKSILNKKILKPAKPAAATL
jgi:hypothetical protein